MLVRPAGCSDNSDDDDDDVRTMGVLPPGHNPIVHKGGR